MLLPTPFLSFQSSSSQSAPATAGPSSRIHDPVKPTPDPCSPWTGDAVEGAYLYKWRRSGVCSTEFSIKPLAVGIFAGACRVAERRNGASVGYEVSLPWTAVKQTGRRGGRRKGKRGDRSARLCAGKLLLSPLCFLVLAWNSFAGHELSAPVAAGRRLKYKKRAPNGGGTCSRN